MKRALSHSVSLKVAFSIQRLTPRGVRRRFVHVLRAAIIGAVCAGAVDRPVAEELWRALPDPERV